MLRHVALAALALAWSVAADARHSFAALDPRSATPGVDLEVVELPPGAPGAAAKYRLRVTGLPEGAAVGVYIKTFGRDFREVISGVRPDAAGVLSPVKSAGLTGPAELDLGPYPRGAAWWIAIASEDHKITAFARLIPYPIAARDGACSLSLELISLFGNRFAATGAGFTPGEEVEIESNASGKLTRKRERVSDDGRLPLDVVMHGSVGADALARYAVKARGCAPAVEYRWGESAVKDR